MSYVRTLTICFLLVYFVSAAGCHCFDLKLLTADLRILRMEIGHGAYYLAQDRGENGIY